MLAFGVSLTLVARAQTITTSPNPKVHKQHLRELLFMRDCTHPNIVQYYGAYLESVRGELCLNVRVPLG